MKMSEIRPFYLVIIAGEARLTRTASCSYTTGLTNMQGRLIGLIINVVYIIDSPSQTSMHRA